MTFTSIISSTWARVEIEEVAVGADAGVGDHDIEAAEALDGRGHQRLELRLVAHVARLCERALDAHVAAAPRRHRNLRARCGEMLAGGGADAAARPGHQGDTTFECAHDLPLISCSGRSAACGGGTSSAGFRSKKPTGFSLNPIVTTGITGQSSGRGTW